MRNEIKPGVAVVIIVVVVAVVGLLGWKLAFGRSDTADLAKIEAENQKRMQGLPSGGFVPYGANQMGGGGQASMPSGGPGQFGGKPTGGPGQYRSMPSGGYGR